MDGLTIFGLFAVSAMLVFYALENRRHWFVLAFAGSCLLASAYGFLQGAWPFGTVEAIWSGVAARRWWRARPKWRTCQIRGTPASGGAMATKRKRELAQKIIHFYCQPCKEYHLKTHPHYMATKRRKAIRRLELDGSQRDLRLATAVRMLGQRTQFGGEHANDVLTKSSRFLSFDS